MPLALQLRALLALILLLLCIYTPSYALRIRGSGRLMAPRDSEDAADRFEGTTGADGNADLVELEKRQKVTVFDPLPGVKKTTAKVVKATTAAPAQATKLPATPTTRTTVTVTVTAPSNVVTQIVTTIVSTIISTGTPNPWASLQRNWLFLSRLLTYGSLLHPSSPAPRSPASPKPPLWLVPVSPANPDHTTNGPSRRPSWTRRRPRQPRSLRPWSMRCLDMWKGGRLLWEVKLIVGKTRWESRWRDVEPG